MNIQKSLRSVTATTRQAIDHYFLGRGINPVKIWAIETPVDRDVYLCHVLGQKSPFVVTGKDIEEEMSRMRLIVDVKTELSDEQTSEE